MNRPARVLATAATALSLLLFATTLVLWARSHRTIVNASPPRAHDAPMRGGSIGRGKLLLFYVRNTPRDPDQWHWPVREVTTEPVHGWIYESYPIRDDAGDMAEWVTLVAERSPDGFSTWARGAGFAFLAGRLFDPRRSGILILVLPLWSLAALFAILPGLGLHRRLRRRAAKTHNLCPTCGYDLRATPERCPECGTIPARCDDSHAPS